MIADRRAKEMRTLYINTYGLGESCSEEDAEKYLQYCEDFANENNMHVVKYQALRSWQCDAEDVESEEETGKFYAEDGMTRRDLNLWDDFCSGVEIKNYELED
jgi:hypothetical protein